MEEWRHTPLCFSHVEVSSLGRVRISDKLAVSMRGGVVNTQLKKGKIISQWVAKNGYYTVAITGDGKRSKFLVHRLVASAFVEGFDPSITVNHKDGNKSNNLPSNLEWVTLQENTRHQWRTGLVDLRGEKHPSHILLDNDVINIQLRIKNG